MWRRRSWFSLKGKAGIPGQTEGCPATSIGPRGPPVGSLQQRGEGHRKVWARLRALDGIRVGRDRVLRLMRENALLSPHRGPQRPVNDHDGRITTDAPGVMWGTDAGR